jgi:hypothetical protein
MSTARGHDAHDGKQGDELPDVGALVDDDVHAEDRRQGRHRQSDRGDHGEPFRRDRHLGVRAGLVELDHALQVLPLPLGHGA